MLCKQLRNREEATVTVNTLNTIKHLSSDHISMHYKTWSFVP